MPPRKQAKELSYLCHLSLSISIATKIIEIQSDEDLETLRVAVQDQLKIPRPIYEILLPNVLRSAFMTMTAIKHRGDFETSWHNVDDHILIRDHCELLQKCLKVMACQNIKNFETEFAIDMRTFQNFSGAKINSESDKNQLNDGQDLIIVTDSDIKDLSDVKSVGNCMENLFKGMNLQIFQPGMFIIGRIGNF